EAAVARFNLFLRNRCSREGATDSACRLRRFYWRSILELLHKEAIRQSLLLAQFFRAKRPGWLLLASTGLAK
ncbi:MAG TPA: hypothetical protein VIG66_09175, partial [Noviherbaspirillum sp.]